MQSAALYRRKQKLKIGHSRGSGTVEESSVIITIHVHVYLLRIQNKQT